MKREALQGTTKVQVLQLLRVLRPCITNDELTVKKLLGALVLDELSQMKRDERREYVADTPLAKCRDVSKITRKSEKFDYFLSPNSEEYRPI